MKKVLCMWIAVMIVLSVLSVWSPMAVQAGAEAGNVTILFTHDLHSHLLPSADGNGGEYGGYARLMTVINQQKDKYPHAILVDGGDFSMGSLFQTAFATSAIELRMLGAMGYDATTFGNHEYDYLPSGLASMLNAAVSSGDRLPAILEGNYLPPKEGGVNLAPFELMSRVLGQCADALQARQLLEQVNVIKADFSPDLPSTPLHWIVADRRHCFVAEPTADGLHLYDDPVGVLTNAPPFPMQLDRLNDCLHLSAAPLVNRFAPHLPLAPYSRGMGALGLPGDWSSPSRFVRAAFAAHNASAPMDVTQFFHLMACVEVPRGCVRLEDGTEVISVYTSCCDMDTGVYHYVTYGNRQICAVELSRRDLDSDRLSCYLLISNQQIRMQS